MNVLNALIKQPKEITLYKKVLKLLH